MEKNVFSSPFKHTSTENLLTQNVVSMVLSGPLWTLKESERTYTLVLATSIHDIGPTGDIMSEWTIFCRLGRGFWKSMPLAHVPTNSPSTPCRREHKQNSNRHISENTKLGGTAAQPLPRAIAHRRCHVGWCTETAPEQSSPGRSASSEPVCSPHSVSWVVCQEYE